jgi:hypothetical protein
MKTWEHDEKQISYISFIREEIFIAFNLNL